MKTEKLFLVNWLQMQKNQRQAVPGVDTFPILCAFLLKTTFKTFEIHISANMRNMLNFQKFRETAMACLRTMWYET